MATKTATKPKAAAKAKSAYPADVQEKIDGYAELHGTTAEKVVELALRDFFVNIDQNKWPRSNSLLEPSPVIK